MEYKNITLPIGLKVELEEMKEISAVRIETTARAKSESCYVCGKKCSSFKNSHTVPKFIINNIYNGKRLHGSLFGEMTDKGLNNVEVIHCLCENCENTLFRDYEDPTAYLNNNITQLMMAEISLKNSLQMIYKRNIEHHIYQIVLERTNSKLANQYKGVGDIDLIDFDNYKNYSLRYINDISELGYVLHYIRRLDYVVPYAFQGFISIVCDLNGKIINDNYNYDKNYHLQLLNVCVFPFVDSTLVFCFARKKDVRYNRFFKQFNKLSEDDKLSYINALIFRYCESIIISDDVDDKVLKDKTLVDLCKKTDRFQMTKKLSTRYLCDDSEGFLIDYKNITNLLSEKYKLR